MKKTSTNNNSFSEKHPVANFVLGCFILFSLLIAISLLLFLFLSLIGKGLNQGAIFLKHFVSTTDKVIIVAMITGSVSIIGVVISSIIAKIIEYRYNVKKYMYDKRPMNLSLFQSRLNLSLPILSHFSKNYQPISLFLTMGLISLLPQVFTGLLEIFFINCLVNTSII